MTRASGKRWLARSCAAAFVVAMSSSSLAVADTNDRERARAHFEQGRRHLKDGRCDLAIGEFKASMDFEPASIGARLNLGDCYAELGRLPDAFHQFREAESIAEKSKDPRLEDARRATAVLEKKLVRVVVREPSPSTSDLVVTVDGVSAGARPWVIVVTPDEPHTIRAAGPGGRRWSAPVQGRPGEIVRLTIDLAEESAAVPETSGKGVERPSNQASTGGLKLTGAIIGGIGLVALAAGAVFGALTIAWKGELETAVNGDPRCAGGYPGSCTSAARSTIEPLQDRAFMASTVATVTTITGAILLTGGTVLYLSAPGDRRSAAVRARLANGAWLEGSF